MKTIHFIYIISLCLIFFSCKEDKGDYYYVPEETKLAYQLNDTLVYRDEANHENKFVVTLARDILFEKGQGTNIFIHELVYEFANMNSACDSCFYSIIIDINYAQHIYWGKSLFIAYSKYTFPIVDSFTIFSDTYEDVHVMNLNRAGNKPDTIYYNYKYGVLQYQDFDGKTWKLFSKTKNATD